VNKESQLKNSTLSP